MNSIEGRAFNRLKVTTKLKLKWYVQSDLKDGTQRGWPTCEVNGRVVAWIKCGTPYSPNVVRTGNHRPLTIYYFDRSRVTCRHAGDSLSFLELPHNAQASCLSEAKAMVTRLFQDNPELIPEWVRE